MINIQVSKTQNRVEHSGDPVRVAAEMACSVGAIYNALKCADQRMAEVFRLMFIELLDPNSPVWTPGEGDLTTMVIQKDAKKGDA